MKKADMKVYVGEPGTGKSKTLIDKALKLVEGGHEVFIATPSDKAKQRLLVEIKQRLNYNLDSDKKILFQLLRSTHVTVKNYHGEANIFLDEISMMNLTDFYALLYQLLPDGLQRHIFAFGDIKQLPSVNENGVLETLLRANESLFPAIKNGFWSFVASDCYEGMKTGKLTIPKLWKQAIKSIEIEALTTNHRLEKWGDGSITSFSDDFYSELFNYHTSTDYENELVECIEDDYLILSPTYARGDKANQILIKHYGTKKYRKVAPFVRNKNNRKEVYLNPDNPRCEELKNKFSFVKSFDNNRKKEDFLLTSFITIHSVQGGEVANVCLFLGDDPIDNTRKFYCRNMLYTALTRGGSDWKLLGNKTDFALMRSIDPEDPKTINNSICNSEALASTMQTIVDLGSSHILTPEEVYALFLDNFHGLAKKANTTEQPYTEARVMQEFRTESPWYWKLANDYGCFHLSWVQKRRKDGGHSRKYGGKNQKKFLALSPKEKEQLKEDKSSRKVSKDKFYADWGMTKDQAKDVLKSL